MSDTNTHGRRVLITGLAGGLAGLLAAQLEGDDRVATIAGVDLVEPGQKFGRTEFIRADLASPRLTRAIASLRIDTLVHLAITAEPGTAGGRSRMKENNVIRTMQLLGAAQQAPGLRRVIIKSTTAVYGSSYADPALLREDVAPNSATGTGYAKDAGEVESYARAFARRRADVNLTILRFANFIGPIDSLLARYLSLPVVPTVLGYDPRLQLCHTTDATQVLARAVTGEHPGIYNVAGPGVVYLSQMVRLAGKPTVPIPSPLVNPVADAVRRTRAIDFTPEQVHFLLYGRVGDITRLRTTFGYEPTYHTRAAVKEFLRERQMTPMVTHDTLLRLEQRLLHMARRVRSHGRHDRHGINGIHGKGGG